jgi:signal transduction histidine kinase
LLEEQIARISSIIDQYQRLGRVHPIPRAIDVNGMLRNVLDMLAFTKRDGITLHTEFTEGLPDCHADADLLAGALENLLANAVDAMPRGGSLTVKTAHADTTDGVLIAVEDDGVGMDARVRERAFDDFYTTKAQGSGLGLAFVKRVAEAHGGSVQLSSTLGRGTSVRLCLPLHAEPQHGE